MFDTLAGLVGEFRFEIGVFCVLMSATFFFAARYVKARGSGL